LINKFLFQKKRTDINKILTSKTPVFTTKRQIPNNFFRGNLEFKNEKFTFSPELKILF
jgi:hypothetical protein